MKLHHHVKNRKKVERFLSLLLVLCIVLTNGSHHMSVAEAADIGSGVHLHTDACYEKTLVCGKEVHGEDCYGIQKNLVCTLPEEEGHTHTDACKSEDGELICGQEEKAGHAHGEECYTEERVLTCTLPNHEDSHTDACYEDRLICGKEEGGSESAVPSGSGESTDKKTDSETPSGTGKPTEETPDSQESSEGREPAKEQLEMDETQWALVCGNKGSDHQHTKECYQRIYCGLKEHSHTDECLDGDGNQTCGMEEHVHEGKCFMEKEPEPQQPEMDETKWALVCGNGESDHQHTKKCYQRIYCGLKEHSHTDECLDRDGNQTCGMEEHVHEEECFVEKELEQPEMDETKWALVCDSDDPNHVHGEECYQAIACGLKEHEHTDKCYDKEGNLTCELEEHKHIEACFLPEEQYEKVHKVNQLIADLPSYEEIAEQFAEYEEDADAYREYLIEILDQVLKAYNAYMELDEELQQFVVGAEEMLQLKEALWAVMEAQTLALYDEGNYGYFQQWQTCGINTSNYCAYGDPKNPSFYPIVISGKGKNVYEALAESYIFESGKDNDWVGIVMRNARSGEPGPYTVERLLNATKRSEAEAENIFRNYHLGSGEFMVLFHGLPTVEVGDRVVLSFGPDWTEAIFKQYGIAATSIDPITKKSHGVRKSDGLGVIVICNNMNPGTKTEDRSGLRKLGSGDGIVSTADRITINLYDYQTDAINAAYRGNNSYPFFRSSTGIDSNSFGARKIDAYAFGNVISNDPTDNQDYVKSGINVGMNNGLGPNKWNGGTTVADTLNGGYPALKNGGSLGYLFSNPVNRGSIDGLFKYDSSTGTYSFDSKENHAEYNAATNRFDVYNSIITPNYIQYPFGNFLPYNKISETETTRVADLGKDDMLRMAAEARKEAMKRTGIEQRRYEGLADGLARFIALMDEEYPQGWSGYDVMNKYAKGEIYGEGTELLQRLYNIDYNISTDFHFGMNMELKFIQPKDGKVKGNDMIYYFEGDDDVWVYIDGKLFLDLSGIHTEVNGEIDFAKGEVRYNGGAITKRFSELGLSNLDLSKDGTFKDYTTHTLNFYYMERGSGSSVCKIDFNLPIMPKNSIAVGKELSTDKPAENWLGNPDFFFRVLKVENDQKTDIPYFVAGTEYKIYDSNFQDTGRTGKVKEDGIFTLKAGEYAVFPELPASSGKYYVWELLDASIYEQYGKVTVDNKAMELKENGGDKLTVEGKTYIGVESEIKDPGASEQTTFIFNNQATTDKFGQLDITKKVEGDADYSNRTFDFEVTLDGKALSTGTKYTVTDADGNSVGGERTVGADGTITLKAGETASIKGILAGTLYTVKEKEASSTDYAVTYKVNDEDVSGNGVGGMILPKTGDGASVRVEVTNRDLMIATMDVELDGKKLLVNPDGKAHAYTFEMVEVADAIGTAKDGAVPESVTVNFAEGETDQREKVIDFKTVTYHARDLFSTDTNPTREPHTFYYQIKESAGEAANTIYDQSTYIIAVTVSMDKETKVMSAAAAIYKDGEEMERDVPLTADSGLKEKILFTNQLTHDLTIAKELEGEQGVSEFSFLVEIADKDSLSVKGKTFKASYIGETEEREITFDADGKSTVSVEVGKALTIRELPYGLSWKVTEINAEAYTTSYVIGGNSLSKEEALAAEGRVPGREAAADSLTDDVDTVTFINSITYELPSTGGPGTTLYTLAGICMMLGACLLYRHMFKGRRYRGI